MPLTTATATVRSGHVFQSRYKSILCREELYLLELVRYIHLNPLRAKFVSDMGQLDRYAYSERSQHPAGAGHGIQHVGQYKFGELAALLGENIAGLNQREMAMAAVKAMRTLSKDLQIPGNLSQFGIKESDIPMLAEGVMKVTRLLANNPRVLTQDDAEKIYRNVLS